MKPRAVIFLLIVAALLVLPTLWQSDRVDTLEDQAENSDARAEDARAQRDALETTVSTLADDVTALRTQAQQSGLEPVAPPAEDRISENPVPSSSDTYEPVSTGPTLAQIEQVVQACFAQGFCTAPRGDEGLAGAEGQAGQAGEAGEDAEEVTPDQIMQGVADCVEAGLCTLPEGPEGPPGPEGPQGPGGPAGQTCPEGYTFTEVRAPFQVNNWFVCVANDGGR